MAGQIGHYQLQGEISRGASGVVYRALGPQGPVALKLLQPGTALDIARFQREAGVLAQLQHPGIVGIHDCGYAQAHPYLVMDLVEGSSLEAVMRNGPMDPQRAVDLVNQAADALGYAHQAGVVHRDIKPGNLVLRPDGRVIVVDFGLASLADARDGGLTRTGELLGTPAYMPPEQAGTARSADARADVYALGATLFALISGRAPFEGSSALEVLEKAVTQPAPLLRSVAPKTPAWVEAVCRRCLEKEPAARYANGLDLCRALQRGPVTPGGGANRALVGLGVGVLLLGGAFGGWALAGGDSGEPTPPPPSDPVSPQPPAPDAERELELRFGPRLGRDTYVNEYQLYCNDNYGSDASFSPGVRRGGWGVGARVGYLDVSLRRLPLSADIQHAELVLTEWRQLEDTPRLSVHRVLGPWIEGTSTHDRQVDGVAWGSGPGSPLADHLVHPDYDPEPLATAEVDTLGTLVFDVTQVVRDWLSGDTAQHGLAVCFVNPPDRPGTWVYPVHSRESPEVNKRPLLRIVYRGPPPAAEEATGLPPRDVADLEALHTYLAAVPSDVPARVERAKLYLRKGIYSQSGQDLATALQHCPLGVPDPAIEPVAEAHFEALLVAHAQRQRGLPVPITALDTFWSSLTPETAGEAVRPGLSERQTVIYARLTEYPNVLHLMQAWEKAKTLWPNDPTLTYEVADTVLAVLRQERFYLQAGEQNAAHFFQLGYRGIKSMLKGDAMTLEQREEAEGLFKTLEAELRKRGVNPAKPR